MGSIARTAGVLRHISEAETLAVRQCY